MATMFLGKPSRRDGSRKWIIEYEDELGRRRTKTAYHDREKSARLKRRIEDRVAAILDGLEDPSDERRAAARRRPLSEHRDVYRKSLEARGASPGHVSTTLRYLAELHEAMGWKGLADVNAADLEAHLATWRTAAAPAPGTPDTTDAPGAPDAQAAPQRGRSARDFNARIKALRAFSRWCVRMGFAVSDPLSAVSTIDESRDRRHVRRAMTEPEMARLLEHAAAGPAVHFRRAGRRFELSGPDRADLYLVLLHTGLRLGEALALTAAMFRDGPEPLLDLPAAITKARRVERLPLTEQAAAALRRRAAIASAGSPLWTVPHKPVDWLLKPDLERAGVAYRDQLGRVLDFHSLRHTFITVLNRRGVTLTTAQRLARHSDPKLTAAVYTTIEDGEKRAALRSAFTPAPPPELPEEPEHEPEPSGPAGGRVGCLIGPGLEGATLHHAEHQPVTLGSWTATPGDGNGLPADPVFWYPDWYTPVTAWPESLTVPFPMTDEGMMPATAKPLDLQALPVQAIRRRSLASSRGGGIRTPDLLTPSQTR